MRGLRCLLVLCGLVSAFALAGGASAHTRAGRHRAGNSVIKPSVSEWQFLSSDATPPDQQFCNSFGRRCFSPQSMANSYDYAVLHAPPFNDEGQGKTIAIID